MRVLGNEAHIQREKPKNKKTQSKKLPEIKQADAKHHSTIDIDKNIYNTFDLLGKGINLTQRNNSVIRRHLTEIKHKSISIEPKSLEEIRTPLLRSVKLKKEIIEDCSNAQIECTNFVEPPECNKKCINVVIKPPVELAECKSNMKAICEDGLSPWTSGSGRSVSIAV